MSEMRFRVIHTMGDPPPYEEFANKPRPAVNWGLPSGNWVGIWGDEWADLIGGEVLKADPGIEYEVWQPDPRADKVYSHRFENGLWHRNFPSRKKRGFLGLKREDYYDSPEMLQELIRIAKNGDTIVVAPTAPDPFTSRIMGAGVPMVNIYHGLPELMIGGHHAVSYNPVVLLHRRLTRMQWRHYLRKIGHIIIGDYLPDGIAFLKRHNPSMRIHTFMIGLDLEVYQRADKTLTRAQLDISQDTFLLFASSRLVPLKQVDKLIISLAGLKKLNFKLIITGHGRRAYEQYLQEQIERSGLSGKVQLVGFVSDQILITYYSAADVFVNTSYFEGGPISSWKAMAIGLPVVTTNVGNAYHYLAEQGAGVILDKIQHETWGEVLRPIIAGETTVKSADTGLVRGILDWKACAKQYIDVYQEVLSSSNDLS